MKLLILTQKVDPNDPVLGFFHRWIVEFAKHYEKVTVVALGVGKYNLPDNVKVLSLGKERGVSKLSYIINFYRYIWRERRQYDAVFVHMNQEYVLLGALFWRFFGRKVYLWRNHAKGTALTRLAVFLSNKVFCTSSGSFTARFRKTKIMPVGVDTNFFKKDITVYKKTNSILFFGRISPVKKVEVFVESCRLLKEKGIIFLADIVGDPTNLDTSYYVQIKNLVANAGLGHVVNFKPAISNNEASALYSQYDVYVNATPAGSLDKTILEALACETLVVTSNQALVGFLDDRFIFTENNSHCLAERLLEIMRWPEAKKNHEGVLGREKVQKKHDLVLLVKEIRVESGL